MYQFEDYELVLQMENGYTEIGSRFLYFVPFYESDGYHERGQLDLSYHLSLDFKKPVTVTYNFLADRSALSLSNWQEASLYHEYYKKTNPSYHLYRIKIPKLDEWGEGNNIYVNWNNQGYPDGYDRTDLYYIISGLWSSISDWGKGYISLENWEPVPPSEYTLDAGNNSVQFEITNTDYIYVVSRVIYIEAASVPIKIINLVEKLFPTTQIERAYFSNDKFTVILSDNTYATFSKNGDFLYLTDESVTLGELPVPAQTYISANYANDFIKKITQTKAGSWEPHVYEILMRSGIKLYFDENGNFSGSFQYGYSKDNLPLSASTYLQNNHPYDKIDNVTFDNEDLLAPQYIVYLSSDAKVYFDSDGSWLETVYYRLDSNQLPAEILTFFENNYPNASFSQISYTLSNSKGPSYDIYTVDKKSFSFDGSGTLLNLEIESLEESELPAAISDFINEHFSDEKINQISYYYRNHGAEIGYNVYFEDRLNVEFDGSGNLTALYGNDISHLPLSARSYVESKYPNSKLLYCNFDKKGYSTTLGLGETVEYKWDLFFESNLWVGLDETVSFVYFLKYEAIINAMPLKITTYLNENYPGQTTVHEFSNYYSQFYNRVIYYVLLDDTVTEIFI
ncbi:MAG: hypothetical protein HC831_31760 [Chloroflexia bacterium]|nr:hypothetical protein [Chloroflexia bacterium]